MDNDIMVAMNSLRQAIEARFNRIEERIGLSDAVSLRYSRDTIHHQKLMVELIQEEVARLGFSEPHFICEEVDNHELELLFLKLAMEGYTIEKIESIHTGFYRYLIMYDDATIELPLS